MMSTPRDSDMPTAASAGLSRSGGSGPGIRVERVAEVRQRLAGGYYHAILVRRKIADGVDRVLRGFERI
jgi:hypothetical protein